MKFVFLRRIIKTLDTVDYFFLRLYKQKDQYDKKLTLLALTNSLKYANITLLFSVVTLFRSSYCLIVSFHFRYLLFDFSGIKLFEACSASFKTSYGKTQSFKHILRNCYFYKQPNVNMTPEHIMQTQFPTRKNFFCA
jgi:hypothetical protein